LLKNGKGILSLRGHYQPEHKSGKNPDQISMQGKGKGQVYKDWRKAAEKNPGG
jgi:hypothetical protein